MTALSNQEEGGPSQQRQATSIQGDKVASSQHISLEEGCIAMQVQSYSEAGKTPTPNSVMGSTGGSGDIQNLDDSTVKKFGTVPFSEIPDREVDWLLPGQLPSGFITALIGDEGVGKGLYSCYLMAQVTAGLKPADVLLISGEDDPESMIRPRLRASGADLNRVHLMYRDRETTSGLPVIPEDIVSLTEQVQATKAVLIVIDPWLSVVSSKLQVKDTQHARRVFDPLARMARMTGVAVLLVGHTNRGDSASSRNRYGATVGIRQVARVGLMALPDLDDPAGLIVGMDKSNVSGIAPAVRFRKLSREGSWCLDVHEDQIGLTVQQLLDREASGPVTDRRHSPLREQVQDLLVIKGRVTRSEIIDLYEASGSTSDSADKAIKRWTTGEHPLMFPESKGVFVSLSDAPPALKNGVAS